MSCVPQKLLLVCLSLAFANNSFANIPVLCDPSCSPDPSTGSSYNVVVADRPICRNTRGKLDGICGIGPGPGGTNNAIGSGSYTYSVPILNLPGRNGLDLQLSLFYNSAVWSIDLPNALATFNPDRDFPAYGFRLDFGFLEFDSGNRVYVLTESDGRKHRLRPGTSPVYNSDDSTYIQYNATTHILTYKNGTQVTYTQWAGASFANLWNPIRITDTNGNRISIAYNSSNHIASIVDTLNRTIIFNYSNTGFLSSITQGAKIYASFAWSSVALNYSFAGLSVSAPGNTTGSGTSNGAAINVISSCTYPNGTGYQFVYGDWGIVNKIQKMSAGTSPSVRDYTSYNYPLASAGALLDTPTYNEQTIYDGVNTNVWTYAITKNALGVVSSYAVTDPSGTKTTVTVSASGDWKDGLPLSVLSQSENTLLWQVDNAWTSDATTNFNPRFSSVTTTLKDTGQQSQTQFVSYDSNGNVTQQKEFDWGLVLRRTTNLSYYTTSNHILDRVSQTLVYDASNNLILRTDFGYDNYSTVPLTTVSGTANHDDANYSSSFTLRGNLTSVTRYANAAAASGAITRTFSYDTLGNLITAQLDCCTQKSWTFTVNTQYSYPETVTRGPSGSTQLSTSATYDNTTGLIATSTDENGNQTTYTYNDPIDRITQVLQPDNIQFNTSYDDISPQAGVTTSTNANSAAEKITYDGQGRVVRQQRLNGVSVVSTVDSTYDDVNRVVKASNPYDPTDSILWNTTQLDAMGRTALITPPSGGSFSFSYSGNSVTASDPSGKQRRSFSDALGRLIQVDEPGVSSPTSGSGSVTVNGVLQVIPATAATHATGSFTVGGLERSGQNCTNASQPIGNSTLPPCPTIYDSGTLSVTVNGFKATVGYGQGSTQSSLASGLASALNSSGSPVSAALSGTTVSLTTKATGANTNYAFSTSGTDDSGFWRSPGFFASLSSSTLTGGKNAAPTIYDSGSVTITVNGTQASTSYGQTSTASTVASGLAQSINSNSSAPVSASISGATVLLTAKTTGAATNYSLSASSATSEPATFARASFTGAASGGTLTGGTDSSIGLASPNSTFYSYGVLDNLLQVNQGVQQRTYGYDSMGRITSVTTPESGGESYFYTTTSGANCSGDSSAVCRRVDARGFTTNYSYDGLNRLTFVSYPDSSTRSWVFNYDEGGPAANAMGRLTSSGDPGPFPSYFESYSYDIMGRVAQMGIGGTSSSGFHGTVNYGYNAAGELSQITYPSGRVVTYDFDPIGRATSVASGDTTYLSVPLSNGYNAADQPLNLTYGNNVQAALGYNDHLQLTSLSYTQGTTSLLGLTYNYTDSSGHNNGQVQGVSDSRGAAFSTSYTYDAWSRLSTAKTNDLTSANTWALSWNYDRYGNRLSQSLTGGTAALPAPQLTVDPATNRMNTAGFSYDASGNMTVDGTTGRMWSYDAENQLTQQTDGGNITVGYSYTPGGLRNGKSLYSAGTVSNATNYIYSGSKVIAEYTNGSLSKEYVYMGNSLLVTIDASGNATYHHPDQLSNRLETGATGAASRTFGHLPFGEVWYETGTADKWKFTSYERDSESEPFDYAAFRYYSNRYGRFVSPDLLGGDATDPQSLNLFAYVNSDPVGAIDPLGLELIDLDFEFDGGGIDGGCGLDGAGFPFCSLDDFIIFLPIGDEGGGGGGAFRNFRDSNQAKFTLCFGSFYVLRGNRSFIGQTGGLPGRPNTRSSIAVDPAQFGGLQDGSQLRPFGEQVSGSVRTPGFGSGRFSFSKIRDVITNRHIRGVPSGNEARAAIAARHPEIPGLGRPLSVEIPGLPGKSGDPDVQPGIIFLPLGQNCPSGTEGPPPLPPPPIPNIEPQ